MSIDEGNRASGYMKGIAARDYAEAYVLRDPEKAALFGGLHVSRVNHLNAWITEEVCLIEGQDGRNAGAFITATRRASCA